MRKYYIDGLRPEVYIRKFEAAMNSEGLLNYIESVKRDYCTQIINKEFLYAQWDLDFIIDLEAGLYQAGVITAEELTV